MKWVAIVLAVGFAAILGVPMIMTAYAQQAPYSYGANQYRTPQGTWGDYGGYGGYCGRGYGSGGGMMGQGYGPGYGMGPGMMGGGVCPIHDCPYDDDSKASPYRPGR